MSVIAALLTLVPVAGAVAPLGVVLMRHRPRPPVPAPAPHVPLELPLPSPVPEELVRIPEAFWLRPDWSGGDNLRDSGTTAFWQRPALPVPPAPPPVVAAKPADQKAPRGSKGDPTPAAEVTAKQIQSTRITSRQDWQYFNKRGHLMATSRPLNETELARRLLRARTPGITDRELASAQVLAWDQQVTPKVYRMVVYTQANGAPRTSVVALERLQEYQLRPGTALTDQCSLAELQLLLGCRALPLDDEGFWLDEELGGDEDDVFS